MSNLTDGTILVGAKWVIDHISAIISGAVLMITFIFSYAYMFWQTTQIPDVKTEISSVSKDIAAMKTDIAVMRAALENIEKKLNKK